MKFGWLTIGVILAVGVACSPRAVAPTEGGVFDATSDIGELVDESDGGVTDATVDAASDAIGDSASTDADTTPDVEVPYWIAHDIDIAGLGVLDDSAECGDPLMLVNPGDPPKGPACGSQCPPPYPCTCGVCPWIQTPEMVYPRYGHAAVWTGKEVLVFGGALSPANAFNKQWPFTAERWDPYGNKGFQEIKLPFNPTLTVGDDIWTRVFWTGKVAIVLAPTPFVFDPETSKATLLDDPDIMSGEALLIGKTLFWWGMDSKTYHTGLGQAGYKARIATLDIESLKWSEVDLPADLDTGTLAFVPYPYCVAELGGDVYVLDPPFLPKSGTGIDRYRTMLYRYQIAKAKWTMVSQGPEGAPRCSYFKWPELGIGGNDAASGSIFFFARTVDGLVYGGQERTLTFSTDQISASASTSYHWSIDSNAWTPIDIGPSSPPSRGRAISTGNRIIVVNAAYPAPIIPPPLIEGFPFAPTIYYPDADSWGYVTEIGAWKYARSREAIVYTGKELLLLGGANGQGISSNSTASTGARIWLPADPTDTDFSGVFP